jgi:hypothetical protein
MDAPYYNGEDNRDDLTLTTVCEACLIALVPDEVARGMCDHCFHDYLGDEAADRAYERKRDDAA